MRSTLCFKKVTLSTFTITTSDIGRFSDFKHDYRSINSNIPVLTYLLEMDIFLIVKYQLKCCLVANDAAPDCRMVWSGAACC